jgi:hypothetical protein
MGAGQPQRVAPTARKLAQTPHNPLVTNALDSVTLLRYSVCRNGKMLERSQTMKLHIRCAGIRTRAQSRADLVATLLCLLVFLGPVSCKKQPSSGATAFESCTRVEMQYKPSTLEYVSPRDEILTPSEVEYLRSLKVITLSDPNEIRALARWIRGELKALGPDFGMAYLRVYVVINWYRGDRLLASTNYSMPPGATDPALYTPAIRALSARVKCFSNIRALRSNKALHEAYRAPYGRSGRFEGLKAYPPPGTWCDAVLATRDERFFRCPSAGEGRCHYALNPDCEPNSPPDVVLLFETKAGWNQHGGPELFTFDNHDPKGGCVVLNDGTAKFIRTKEELAQLRWKP